MKKKIRLKSWLQSTGIVLGLLMLLTPTLAQSTDENQSHIFLPLVISRSEANFAVTERNVKEGGLVVLRADYTYFPARVAPPDLIASHQMRAQSVNITTHYNPASCPAGSTTPWSNEARAAFEFATTIWEALLDGNQTIVIDACWRNDFGSSVLGSAGATTYRKDFANAPQSSTRYPIGLANQLANSDLNGDEAEIVANFSSNFSWYLDTDGNTPKDQFDFVSVVLHEIGHGLGFAASFDYNCGGNGIGCRSGEPIAFDRFIENGSGSNLVSAFSNNATELGKQLVSNNLFFDGENANAANSSSRVKLYAPAIWESGSSISHLDESFNGTSHALMTKSLNNGESVHHPGTVTLGILRDMGWNRSISTIYVNASATGVEDGSALRPFNTILEGVNAVSANGIVLIQAGTYREVLTIQRPMELRNNGGVVTIQP